MYTLTIYTPTYNRGYTLENLYKSLCKQTNKNFIWLVIDDGSTDNTELLINAWKSECVVNIEYVRKNNGGKHTATNLALTICVTPLFVCVDSDDFLSPEAVSKICEYWNEENQDNILGIYGRQGDYKGNNYDKNWPLKTKYSKMNDIYSKYKYKGETIMVFNHQIIKNYSFPVYEDERFITESAYYDKFDKILPMRIINDILYFSEYREDGYTTQGMNLFIRNPKGYAYYLKQRASLHQNLKVKLVSSVKYFSWIKSNGLKDSIFIEIKLSLWVSIIGRIFSLYYSKRYIDMRENCEY